MSKKLFHREESRDLSVLHHGSRAVPGDRRFGSIQPTSPATCPLVIDSCDLDGSSWPQPVHQIKSCRSIMICLLATLCGALTLHLLNDFLMRQHGALECQDQLIPHGKLLAGVAGSAAAVKCDKGYAQAAQVSLKCLPMSAENCGHTKCGKQHRYMSDHADEKKRAKDKDAGHRPNDDTVEQSLAKACQPARMKLHHGGKHSHHQTQSASPGSSKQPSLSKSAWAVIAVLIVGLIAVLCGAELTRARDEEATKAALELLCACQEVPEVCTVEPVELDHIEPVASSLHYIVQLDPYGKLKSGSGTLKDMVVFDRGEE